MTQVRTTCLAIGLLGLLGETGASPASGGEALSHETLDHIWAITPDPDHGKILYLMHCRACHGNHAWGDGPRAIPALAGQREKYLVGQMMQFATGKRAGRSMHDTMQRSDLDWGQGVRDLGSYLSAAPRSPSPDYAESRDTTAGKRIYQQTCSACHGVRGEGKETGLPAIGGQHYQYLVAQLSNFSDGHRGAGDQPLLESMGSFTLQQVQEVANYTSHLGYLTVDDHLP